MSDEKSCENCGHLIGLLNPKPECERFDDQDCILNGRFNWIPRTVGEKQTFDDELRRAEAMEKGVDR